MPGPSVFPSGEPGVSGDFWGSQEGCQGPSRLESQDALPLATRPASSVLARAGAGCGSVGDVTGSWLASAPLWPSLWMLPGCSDSRKDLSLCDSHLLPG